MSENNVTRFLKAKKIQFQLLESEPSHRSAIETATLFNLDPMTVYKTIVVKAEKSTKNILCIVPGPLEVNVKKVAVLINEKKTAVVTQAAAEKLTGSEAGGISPLALIHRGFQMLIHESVLSQPVISISGGQRGFTILLSSADLLSLLPLRIADIADTPAVKGRI